MKICGITSEEDGRVALEAGANALGFNFYRKSPRYIAPERAREIIDRLSGNFLKVGIFVNPSTEELARVARMLGCDVVQLHGDACPREAPEACRVWRCLTVFSPPPERDTVIDAYLLDTPGPAFGGSGKTIDWKLAASFPYRKIIAGGLDGENVAAAISMTVPQGVDACSRLESKPGKKDAKRVRDFVRQAVAAARALTAQETV